MSKVGLGQVVAEAWEACLSDEERRRRDRVTELHRWERRGNHRWVDAGWLKCPSRQESWLLEMLSKEAV